MLFTLATMPQYISICQSPKWPCPENDLIPGLQQGLYFPRQIQVSAFFQTLISLGHWPVFKIIASKSPFISSCLYPTLPMDTVAGLWWWIACCLLYISSLSVGLICSSVLCPIFFHLAKANSLHLVKVSPFSLQMIFYWLFYSMFHCWWNVPVKVQERPRKVTATTTIQTDSREKTLWLIIVPCPTLAPLLVFSMSSNSSIRIKTLLKLIPYMIAVVCVQCVLLIAHVLSTYSSPPPLNHSSNTTLKQLIKALFRGPKMTCQETSGDPQAGFKTSFRVISCQIEGGLSLAEW